MSLERLYQDPYEKKIMQQYHGDPKQRREFPSLGSKVLGMAKHFLAFGAVLAGLKTVGKFGGKGVAKLLTSRAVESLRGTKLFGKSLDGLVKGAQNIITRNERDYISRWSSSVRVYDEWKKNWDIKRKLFHTRKFGVRAYKHVDKVTERYSKFYRGKLADFWSAPNASERITGKVLRRGSELVNTSAALYASNKILGFYPDRSGQQSPAWYNLPAHIADFTKFSLQTAPSLIVLGMLGGAAKLTKEHTSSLIINASKLSGLSKWAPTALAKATKIVPPIGAALRGVKSYWNALQYNARELFPLPRKLLSYAGGQFKRTFDKYLKAPTQSTTSEFEFVIDELNKATDLVPFSKKRIITSWVRNYRSKVIPSFLERMLDLRRPALSKPALQHLMNVYKGKDKDWFKRTLETLTNKGVPLYDKGVYTKGKSTGSIIDLRNLHPTEMLRRSFSFMNDHLRLGKAAWPVGPLRILSLFGLDRALYNKPLIKVIDYKEKIPIGLNGRTIGGVYEYGLVPPGAPKATGAFFDNRFWSIFRDMEGRSSLVPITSNKEKFLYMATGRNSAERVIAENYTKLSVIQGKSYEELTRRLGPLGPPIAKALKWLDVDHFTSRGGVPGYFKGVIDKFLSRNSPPHLFNLAREAVNPSATQPMRTSFFTTLRTTLRRTGSYASRIFKNPKVLETFGIDPTMSEPEILKGVMGRIKTIDAELGAGGSQSRGSRLLRTFKVRELVRQVENDHSFESWKHTMRRAGRSHEITGKQNLLEYMAADKFIKRANYTAELDAMDIFSNQLYKAGTINDTQRSALKIWLQRFQMEDLFAERGFVMDQELTNNVATMVKLHKKDYQTVMDKLFKPLTAWYRGDDIRDLSDTLAGGIEPEVFPYSGFSTIPLKNAQFLKPGYTAHAPPTKNDIMTVGIGNTIGSYYANRFNSLLDYIGLGMDMSKYKTGSAWLTKGLLLKRVLPIAGAMTAFDWTDKLVDICPLFDGSLPYNELILVRNKKTKEIKLVEIGKFVNEFNYKKYDAWTNYGGWMRWCSIKDGIKHKRITSVARIQLEKYADILVTTNHSLFTGTQRYLEKAKPELGKYIVACHELPKQESVINKICILDYIKNKEKYICLVKNLNFHIMNYIKNKKYGNKNNYNVDLDEKYLDWINTNVKYYKMKYYSNINDVKKLDEKYLNNITLFWKEGKCEIPIVYNLDYYFGRLIGFYVSEGHACFNKTHFIQFAASKDYNGYKGNIRKKIIHDIKYVFNDTKIEVNSKGIKLNGILYTKFFADIIGCCEGSENKRIPDFIINGTDKIKRGFLEGYFLGDGNLHSNTSFIFTTSSRKLAIDLVYLLRQFDTQIGIYSRFRENGNGCIDNRKIQAKFREYSITVRGIKIGGFYCKKSIDMRAKRKDNFSSKIKEIEILKNQPDYVYDISVQGSEKFIGGFYIYAHNTIFDEGLGVAAADLGVKARMLTAGASDVLGITAASKYAEGLMPGFIDSPLMRVMRGAVMPLLVGGAVGSHFAGLPGAGVGLLTGAGLGAFQGFGAFDLTKSREELEEIYSGREEVPIRRGRWWMLCELPGTKIVINEGIKNIENIKKDDLVLTSNNKYEKVLNRFEYDVEKEDKFIKIIPYYNVGISCSDNHIIPILRDSKIIEVPARDITLDDYIIYPKVKFNRKLKELKLIDYIKNKTILVDNKERVGYIYLLQKKARVKSITQCNLLQKSRCKKISSKINTNKDFGLIIGYFLSEGSLFKTKDNRGIRGIEFTFNNNENYYINELKNAIEKVFGLFNYSIKKDKGKNCEHLRYFNTLLGNIFNTWFGDNKKIPDWLYQICDDNFYRGLLKGFFEGDGYIRNKTNFCIAQSKLHLQILVFIRHLLLNCNIVSSLTRKDIILDNKKYPGYILSIYGEDSNKFSHFCNLKKSKNRKDVRNVNNGHFKIINNLSFYKIRKIENIKYSGKKYDLEIENNHDYTTISGIVHNSSNSFQGGRIQHFRPNWYARLKAKYRATPDGLGAPVEQMVHKPLPFIEASVSDLDPLGLIFKPHHYAYRHYHSQPYPYTGTAFEEVPFVGPTLATTVGRLVKPPHRMHKQELEASLGMSPGGWNPTYRNTPGGGLAGGTTPSMFEPGSIRLMKKEPVSPNSIVQAFDEQLYRTTEAAGLHGFMAETMTEKMFGFCLTGDNLILTNGELKYLKDIIVGDKVINNKGEITIVKNKFIREVQRYLDITLSGCTFEKLSCTPEHKIFAVKRELCWKRKNQKKIPYCSGKEINEDRCKECHKDNLQATKLLPQWIDAKDLKLGDMIAMPLFKRGKNLKKILDIKKYFDEIFVKNNRIYDKRKMGCGSGLPFKINLNYDFGYLCGIYLAEGSIKNHDDGNVEFALNNNELYIAKKIRNIVKIYNYSISVYEKNDSESITVEINSRIFGRFIYRFLGSFLEKHLPKEIWKYNKKFVKGLLCGYLDGDGCDYSRGRKKSKCQYISAKSTNYNLIKEIRLLFYFLNLRIPNLSSNKPKLITMKDKKHFGQKINSNKSYILELPHANKEFAFIYNKKSNISNYYSYCDSFIYNLYYFKTIKNIKIKNEKIDVYDLEVENNSSYTTILGSVHNSQPFEGQNIMASASEITSFRRQYWDLSLGDPLGFTELWRRFVPRQRQHLNRWNPLINTMPAWMPDQFHVGNPYCLHPETLIETKSGLIKAKDIKSGNCIYTHKGKYKRIKKLWKRGMRNNETMYKLTVSGLSYFDIKLTENHPVLVAKPMKCNITSQKCFPIKEKYNCRNKYCKFDWSNYKYDWEFTKNINPGDFVLYPISNIENNIIIDLSKYTKFSFTNNFIYMYGDNEFVEILEWLESNKKKFLWGERNNILKKYNWNAKKFENAQRTLKREQIKRYNRYIQFDKDLALIIGYYLSEGYSDLNSIKFAFCVDEIDTCIKELKQAFINKFNIKGYIKKHGARGVEYIIHDSILSQFFHNYIGLGFDKKKIPIEIIDSKKEFLIFLLRGVIRGDGTYFDKKRECISLKLSNLNLIYQVRKILLKLGFISTFSYNKERISKKYKSIGDKQVHSSESWAINISGIHANKLGYILGFNIITNKIYNKVRYENFILNDYVYCLVKNIKKVNYKGKVYGYTIEDDKSFCIAGVATHNSQVPEGELLLPGLGYESAHDVRMTFPAHADMLGLTVEDTVRSMLGLYPHSPTKYAHSSTDLDRKNREILTSSTVFDPYHNISGMHDGIIRAGRDQVVKVIKKLSDEDLNSFMGPPSSDISEINWYMKQINSPAGLLQYSYNGQAVATYPVKYSQERYLRDSEVIRKARYYARDLLEKGLGWGGESYSHMDRLKILANIAPYSDEYHMEEEIVRLQIKSGYPIQDELNKVRQKRRAMMIKGEMFPYRFRGKVLSPDAYYNNLSLNENIKTADQYGMFERFIGSQWEKLCVSKNTFIETKEGIKEAKDVKVGNIVLTENGTWQKIKKIFKRKLNSNEIVLTMHSKYTPRGITITSNHEIYAAKNRVCICKVRNHEGMHLEKRTAKFCNNCYKLISPKWIPAGELMPGDMFVYPIMKFNNINEINLMDYLSKDKFHIEDDKICVNKHKWTHTHRLENKINDLNKFYSLLGWFLAEGSYAKNLKYINFCLGITENNYCNEIVALIKDLFGLKCSIRKDYKHNRIVIIVHSIILGCFFNNFGKKSWKKLPYDIVPENKKYLRNLARSYILGDGKIDRKEGAIVTSSISSNLSGYMRHIFTKLGYIASIGKYENKGRNYKYSLTFSRDSARRIANEIFNLNWKFPEKIVKTGTFIKDGYIYYPITSVTVSNYRDEVYDFEIENIHSYSLLAVVVHNSHLSTPIHSKFLHMRTPREAYERGTLWGRDLKMWSHPVDHFMNAYARGFMSKTTPFQGTLAGAMAGSLIGGPGMGSIAGGAIGGLYGGIHGVIRSLTGTTYIPGSIKEGRGINRYFDNIQYNKNMMLYESTGDERFLEEAKATMTGLIPSDTSRSGWSYMYRATPPQERPYIMAFIRERNPDERQKILERVPAEVEEVLKTKWAKADGGFYDAIRSQDQTEALPSPDWLGWAKEVPLKDVELKVIENTGLDAHDWGLGWYDQQNRVNESPWLDRIAVDMNTSRNKNVSMVYNQNIPEVRRNIEIMLRQYGEQGSVVVTPGAQNIVTIINT